MLRYFTDVQYVSPDEKSTNDRFMNTSETRDVDPMIRRWPNFNSALVQCFVYLYIG